MYVRLKLTRAELLDALTTLATEKMMAGEWDSSWEINKSLDEFLAANEDTSIESKRPDSADEKPPTPCASCGGVMALNGAPATKWEGLMECQRCGKPVTL